MILWLLASYPWIHWFFSGLEVHFDALNTILLIAVFLIWANSLRGKKFFSGDSFYYNPLAMVIGLTALVFAVFFKSEANLRIASFTFSIILLYALLSIVIAPLQWRKGLIPLLLLLMTLPFGRHLDLLVGYPLRVFAAEVGFEFISAFNSDIKSVNTILILENKATQVNVDCSGLRGLWIGMLFYFAIAWIEKASINLRFASGFIALILIIILGNVIRVTALSISNLYAGLESLDPWIHHSLSVFFLLLSSLVGYLFLRQNSSEKGAEFDESEVQTKQLKSHWAWVTFIPLLTLLFTPSYVPAYHSTDYIQSLEEQLTQTNWERLALKSNESDLFSKEGVQALKMSKDNSELMVISGGDWRTHHIPEVCYDLAGYSIDSMQTIILEDKLSLKELNFRNEEGKAYYWFQHGDNATDDYASMFWGQLLNSDERWTQVSLVTNTSIKSTEDIQLIYNLIKSQP